MLNFKKTKEVKGKMKRQLGLLALMAVLVVGLASVSYAAVTCVFDQATTTAGTSSSYIRGATKNLSVTLSGWTDDANSSVAIISAGATGCSISGALTFNTSTNTNQSYMNTTVNTLAMRDDTTCTFTMTIKNASNQAALTTCTRNYISDNTQPVCTHSASSKTDYKPDRTWTVTGTNASSATLQFGAQPAFTMAEASDVFTYTTTRSSLPEGVYNTIKAITNDGLNTTACTLDYVTIDSRARAQQIVIASAVGQKQAETEPIIVKTTSSNRSIWVVLLIVVAGFWWIKRKK